MSLIPVIGYRSGAIYASITIEAGQTVSQGFSTRELISSGGPDDPLVKGSFSLRLLMLPSNFTTCTINFQLFSDATYSSAASILMMPDGSDNNDFVIPNSAPDRCMGLIPFVFDSMEFFKIECSIAQVSTVQIQGIFQPIYQVPR